jgi:serine/threonine-protein kinase
MLSSRSKSPRTRVKRKAWLTALCALAAVGGWAAPAGAVTFSQQSLPFSGLRDPFGVAVDGAGDVFVADTQNSRGLELPAGSSTQQMLPFSGNFPFGVAADGVGDVFVADTGSSRVLELLAGSSTQQTLPFSGLTEPVGVAVDGAGDVFVTDLANSRVLELPVGSSTQQAVPFSGLNGPAGVAVDGAGDVFVTDAPNTRVLELPAGSTTQQTLPFSGLNDPFGVAVDGAGDVFVADLAVTDPGKSRVLELPAGSSTQQTLPFSGLSGPAGVAVDGAGDVFVADSNNSRVVELASSFSSGSFAISPGSGPAGSSIGVASVTPCQLLTGGAFAATEARLFLYSSAGELLGTATVALGDSGSWAGALPVPTSTADGTTFVVRARCTDSEGVMAQAYAPATFTVAAPVPGPQGPPGAQGNPGTDGTNGTNGTNGATGATGAQGAQGPAGPAGAIGPAGAAAPELLSESSSCTTKPTQNNGSTTSCTYTFTYATTAAAKDVNVLAVAKLGDHRRVIARGRLRHHKLTLVFRHLRRGRYQLTLLAIGAHGKRTVIGHTSIVIN